MDKINNRFEKIYLKEQEIFNKEIFDKEILEQNLKNDLKNQNLIEKLNKINYNNIYNIFD